MKAEDHRSINMKGNILIDLRNALNPDSFSGSGFDLIQIGRQRILASNICPK